MELLDYPSHLFLVKSDGIRVAVLLEEFLGPLDFATLTPTD